MSQWLEWVRAEASPRHLELLALQLAVIAAAIIVAYGIRLVTRSFTDPVAFRIGRYFPAGWLPADLQKLAVLAYAWLLLIVAARLADQFALDLKIVKVAATLTALWIVLRASTLVLRDALLARLVAAAAWIVAALDITGLMAPTVAALDSVAVTVGSVRLTLLLVLKAALLIAVLMWGALALARLLGSRIQMVTDLSPSVQILTANLIRIALVSLALLIALNMVGIDLTAFAVFSGAVGVGLGFGLQKIVSNFVSGIILLVERSIKPGDVIEVGHTYGSVSALGARYASVRGRDGKEYLIPNETLITNQVVNWSYSNSLVRLDMAFGVGYSSDLREVRQIAIEAAQQNNRIVGSPPPVCHITEFGDNGVNLMLRFWIEDPASGVANVKGDVYLAIWDKFKERDVELPFPQRDIYIKNIPENLLRPERLAAADESQRDTAQPQGIADDGDGGQAHRRAGNHRIEQQPE
jgi:small-conductance mechanosensitive channel